MNRVLEIALVIPVAVPAALAIGVAACAVKLSSPGPAFYSQRRVGQHRRPFRVLKLRTMHVGADRVGAHITAGGDTRVTRIGKFLRATKIDELPQLLAVLRGEMSLVGPRPEAERYVAAYLPAWERVFDVRPGITDLASIAFRNEETLLALARDKERAYVQAVLPAKMQVVLEGVDRRSTRHDLAVIMKTLAAVLAPARMPEHPAVARAREAIRQLEHEPHHSHAQHHS
jgi:lipopolysaccharide/colanic/teichoic acid biosynthesis glycosyltransferase